MKEGCAVFPWFSKKEKEKRNQRYLKAHNDAHAILIVELHIYNEGTEQIGRGGLGWYLRLFFSALGIT